MEKKSFVNILLEWYNYHKRDLPWRASRDPFHIWLSEIVLQQTRVSQGLPYYEKFTARFKNVASLANADEMEVMRLWQGLGYYSRARNLMEGAKMVMEDFNGKLPGTYRELIRIKGIGPYTAAAIASIAFGEKISSIDGNWIRVASRVYGIQSPFLSPEGKSQFLELGVELMKDCKNPGDLNQAIMEFGALQCIPRPDCTECPLKQHCYAHSHNLVDKLPLKNKKISRKTRYFQYLVFNDANHFLLNKRDKKDIWNGLFDFYLIERSDRFPDHQDAESALNGMGLNEDVLLKEPSRAYKHVLTHQTIFARFQQILLKDKKSISRLEEYTSLQKFPVHELDDLPKPVLINNYLKDELF